jgi:hypothetical protein
MEKGLSVMVMEEELLCNGLKVLYSLAMELRNHKEIVLREVVVEQVPKKVIQKIIDSNSN